MNLRKEPIVNKCFHILWLTFIVFLTISYLDARKDITDICRDLKTKANLSAIYARARYIDLCLHDIEYKVDGTSSIAEAAYDKAQFVIDMKEYNNEFSK